MRDFDVVVVGGGVAGIWAAIAARGAGARTALVERHERIGEHIICAEGVGARGIGGFIELRPEWISAKIEVAELHAPGVKPVVIREGGAGFILNKEAFLRGLAEKATRGGVQILVGTEASSVAVPSGHDLEVSTLSKSRGRQATWGCGAAVVADGIESRIGRSLGICGALRPTEIFLCAQYTVSPIEVRTDTVEFHFGNQVAPGGYAWVFPKGDSTANLGVGILRQTSSTMRSSVANPMEWLARFRNARAPRSEVLRQVVGGVPALKQPFKAFSRGVFLAGDAARIADPVTGAGIVPGMESGEICGTFAARYAQGGEADCLEREFTGAMKQRFADRRLRFAARKALGEMSDKELARMVKAIGEFAAGGDLLGSNPVALLKFMVKSMPTTFRLAKHLVGV